MIAILFWASLGLIVYVYVAFPALLLLRSLVWKRPHREAEITPRASLIIAAYNEEANIAAKLDNALALDYPRDRLEVIVASDGSEDATEAIAARYATHGVRLLARPREGKIAALSAAVAAATGEVLVFSDANSIYAPDALRALVRPLADARVGGVAGDERHRDGPSAAGAGQRHYWNLDRMLKRWQSAAGSVTSATGAIYAIRRPLYRPPPPGVTDDFAISTGVIAQGYRLVFAPRATACEPADLDGPREFRRKIRIATRGLRGVAARRELLDPRRYGFYALQLLSHKVLRRLMVFPLLVLLGASAALWSAGPFYAAALAAQMAFYGCAGLGLLLADQRGGRARILAIPCFFCLANLACLVAIFHILCGRRIDCWVPQRARPPVPEPVAGPSPGERSETPCWR